MVLVLSAKHAIGEFEHDQTVIMSEPRSINTFWRAHLDTPKNPRVYHIWTPVVSCGLGRYWHVEKGVESDDRHWYSRRMNWIRLWNSMWIDKGVKRRIEWKVEFDREPKGINNNNELNWAVTRVTLSLTSAVCNRLSSRRWQRAHNPVYTHSNNPSSTVVVVI